MKFYRHSYLKNLVSRHSRSLAPVVEKGAEKRANSSLQTSIVLEVRHRDSAIPFWALLTFTFILFVSPQSFIPQLAPLHIAFLMAMLAVITYLYDRLVSRRPIIVFNRETITVLCLLWWVILTMPLSYWPMGSINTLTNFYIKSLIVFFLMSHVVNTLPRLRIMAWGLSLMTVPIALTALTNLLVGDYIDKASGSRIMGYDAPLTGNPNDLALTLNLLLPFIIALFYSSRTRAIRSVLLACICLNVAAIIATFSRAGFLTLSVIFVLYVLNMFNRQQWKWALFAFFLCAATLPFLPSNYLERLSTITQIDADPTGSAQARWGDTIAAATYVLAHPVIGAGIGMDTLALNEVRGPTWTETHNVYLQYAVDLGIPGLILFIILLSGSIKSAREAQQIAARTPEAEQLYRLAEAIRISLIAFSVAAIFHPVAYHIYFYFIAGLALAVRSISHQNNEKPRRQQMYIPPPIDARSMP